MRFDTDLQAYLPEWFREIADYRELCLTEAQCFEALAAEINAVADNFFFQTMDKSSVALWEQVFQILPDPALESLEFRRERLLNRISSRPPYTLSFLSQKLDELIGKNQWQVWVDYPNYTLYIESSAHSQSYAVEVAHTIGRIKPAHIVYVNSPFVSSGLELSETIETARRTYHYKLGGWGLGLMPFAMEENQGVIKMANIPSVQAQLLNVVAGFVAGDIAKARINGTILIETLAKEVAGSVATITYTVAQSAGEAVTQVELLDAGDKVLTSSVVYVPITGSTVMKHRIPVMEGDG